MKNGKKLIIFGLLVLLCTCFVTCYNPIMEKWWPEAAAVDTTPQTDEPGPSGINFAVVVFNTDGGIAEDGSVPLPVRVLWDNTIPRIRALTKTVGTTPYGFAGWMDENDDLWDIETRPVKPEDDVNEDGFITLTAKWSVVSYNVTFNTNYPSLTTALRDGSQISVSDQVIAHGGKAVEPSVIPTGDGHGLVGWYIGPPGSYDPDDEGGTHGWGKKWDFANDEVTENITLFARWSLYTRTVHLQVNGGTRPGPVYPPGSPPMEITRVNFTIFTGLGGETGGLIIDPGPIAREGYTFGGWYTNMAFTDEWSFSRKVYGTDAIYEGRIRNDPFTLYARWVPNIYIVILNANEGTPIQSTQAVAHGERVIKPNITGTPDRVLVGWYTLNGLNNGGNWGTEWDFEKNVVDRSMILHAMWDEKEYEVHFHLGGGDGRTLPSSGQQGYFQPPVQYLLYAGKVNEPFMPALAPNDTTNWSFYRWEYSTADPDTYPEGINDPDFRSTLLPWNFDWELSDAPSGVLDVNDILHLYAKWVPPVPGMVWVPRGSFIMGESGVSGSPAILHAYPTRVVTLDGFYINRTLVTQIEYKTLTTANYGKYNALNPITPDPSNTKGDNNPVERVSWFDAIRYCILLSEENSLNPVYSITPLSSVIIPPTAVISGLYSINSATVTIVDWNNDGYRLPTEAEWEYAAKGGNGMGPYTTYSGSNDATLVSWFNTNSSGRTHPVNTMTRNSLGIYDMCGNVSEWCWDSLESYKNLTTNLLNPRLDSNPSDHNIQRIRRGGAWSNTMANVRTVVRNSDTPDTAHWAIGMRVVRGPSVTW